VLRKGKIVAAEPNLLDDSERENRYAAEFVGDRFVLP
jgi:hypothetical protein